MKRVARILAMAVPLVAAAIMMLLAQPAYSYLPGLASATALIHWSSLPATWNLNPDISTAKVSGSRSVADVMQAAFNTWTGAPNTGVTATRGADSSVSSEGSSPNGTNLICFVCSDTDFTKDASTLAVTIFHFDQGSGVMTKADILFNPVDAFTTDPASASDTVTDLQTVATHEVGHFFGLDHSAVVSAIMFPFSPAIRETLAYDDVAAIANTYPGAQRVAVGSIQGTVRLNGSGVFGAHVFADSTSTVQGYGAGVRKGPIGALTAPVGSYTITGLPVDTYVVTAEPLDGPVTNADVSDYPKVFGQASVQTNFTTRQH